MHFLSNAKINRQQIIGATNETEENCQKLVRKTVFANRNQHGRDEIVNQAANVAVSNGRPNK